jgi:hypothetical protein
LIATARLMPGGRRVATKYFKIHTRGESESLRQSRDQTRGKAKRKLDAEIHAVAVKSHVLALHFSHLGLRKL